MMNISIICIGKLKERYWVDAISEYSKRLSSYCHLDIIELKESKLADKASAAEEEMVKQAEGEEILKRIKDNVHVITLEIQGKSSSSEELAERIEHLSVNGVSNIAFVIGGSLGLSQAVSRRANEKLSFSKMTFPHQMMRVILVEQIYRSFKIIRNEAYHK
ncbi:23S rRNA (pseudouridine1915-N3)-methyltransferase [Clostridiales Family XIII bacterium PM5-7]